MLPFLTTFQVNITKEVNNIKDTITQSENIEKNKQI